VSVSRVALGVCGPQYHRLEIGVSRLAGRLLRREVGVSRLDGRLLRREVGVSWLDGWLLRREVGVTRLDGGLLRREVVQRTKVFVVFRKWLGHRSSSTSTAE
jgi:hypothetical protein